MIDLVFRRFMIFFLNKMTIDVNFKACQFLSCIYTHCFKGGRRRRERREVTLESNFVRQSRSLHHSRLYSGTSQISVSFLLLSLRLFYRLVFGQSRKKILDKKWLGVLSSTQRRSASFPVSLPCLPFTGVLHGRAKLGSSLSRPSNTFRRW